MPPPTPPVHHPPTDSNLYKLFLTNVETLKLRKATGEDACAYFADSVVAKG